MLPQKKIATVILTKNAASQIENCLQSVYGWADEIIIVDGQSTDPTLEICKKYTDKVFIHPFQGSFSEDRNFGADQAKSEWILQLDADERVDEDGPKIPVHCSSPCSDTFVCELLSLSQRRLLNVVTARKCLNIEHLLATTTFASKFKRTYNLYIIHLNEICVNTSVMVQ